MPEVKWVFCICRGGPLDGQEIRTSLYAEVYPALGGVYQRRVLARMPWLGDLSWDLTHEGSAMTTTKLRLNREGTSRDAG